LKEPNKGEHLALPYKGSASFRIAVQGNPDVTHTSSAAQGGSIAKRGFTPEHMRPAPRWVWYTYLSGTGVVIARRAIV